MSPRALAGRAAELQTEALPKLADLQLVGLGAVPDRFLAPRERLGDGAHAHALARQRVQLLDLVLPPRLPVTLEFFVAHDQPPCDRRIAHKKRAAPSGRPFHCCQARLFTSSGGLAQASGSELDAGPSIGADMVAAVIGEADLIDRLAVGGAI